jgi:hypothetical protein
MLRSEREPRAVDQIVENTPTPRRISSAGRVKKVLLRRVTAQKSGAHQYFLAITFRLNGTSAATEADGHAAPSTEEFGNVPIWPVLFASILTPKRPNVLLDRRRAKNLPSIVSSKDPRLPVKPEVQFASKG